MTLTNWVDWVSPAGRIVDWSTRNSTLWTQWTVPGSRTAFTAQFNPKEVGINSFVFHNITWTVAAARDLDGHSAGYADLDGQSAGLEDLDGQSAGNE